MSHPTSNQVHNLVFHLNPGCMSPPSRSRKLHLSSIPVLFQRFHVSRHAAQLNPGPISPPIHFLRLTSHLNLGSYIQVASSSRSHLTSIQLLIFAFGQQQGDVSPQFQFPPPKKKIKKNCISVPPRHHLKPSQISICASNLHPGPAQPNSGHKILFSPSSLSRLHQGP